MRRLRSLSGCRGAVHLPQYAWEEPADGGRAPCRGSGRTDDIKRNYEKYLQKLINNNGEIEFQKLHFINKENAIQQLQNLKRPKREYLTELLKVDSNNIE